MIGTTYLHCEITGKLEQLAESLGSQSGSADNHRHGVGVDGIVAGDRDDPLPIRHDDVSALPCDTESGFFQGAHRAEMRDSRNRHLALEHNLPALTGARQFVGHSEVFADGVAYVVERLLFGISLRSTAGKSGHPGAVALFRLAQRNRVANFAHDQSLARRGLQAVARHALRAIPTPDS